MTDRSNDEVIRAYLEAHRVHDYETVDSLRSDDWTEEWPQTGERVRGKANDRAIMTHWPGGLPEADRIRVVGSEDRWVLTPAMTMQRIVGTGDTWWADGSSVYPDGSRWFAAGLFELRGGKVRRETWYFAPPLDPPPWRAQWVERIE